VLYLLLAGASQGHTIRGLFFIPAQSQSCRHASPILSTWAVSVVQPVNSSTAAWRFCLLVASSFFPYPTRCTSSRSFTTTHHKSGDQKTPCAQPLSGVPSMVTFSWLTVKFLFAKMSSTQSISSSGTSGLIFYVCGSVHLGNMYV
jgi:hypothetical protein